MGFLARVISFLFWVVVAAWLVRKLVDLLLPGLKRKEVKSAPPPIAKPLYRDPWCGTHVSAEISHKLEEEGQVLHFCSAECRERYQASRRRAANG